MMNLLIVISIIMVVISTCIFIAGIIVYKNLNTFKKANEMMEGTLKRTCEKMKHGFEIK